MQSQKFPYTKAIFTHYTFLMRYLLILLCSLTFLASCTVTKDAVKSTSSWTTTSTATLASPTYGTGKHELKIFADFQCPACINFSKTLAPVFEDYAKNGYLHITYKQYPLMNIHKNAERDALSALCVAAQGNDVYMDYKHALYTMEDAKKWASTSDEDRVAAAKDITKIDSTKLASCLADETYATKLQQDIDEGNALRIEGTPTIFLDDKLLDLGTFRDIETLKTVMNRILEVPSTASGVTTATGKTK